MSKIWVVTGASRGIGFEIASAALAAGDRVLATARNRDAITAAFASQRDRVLALELDVTRETQAVKAVQWALARFGLIDVLVNNAGYGQLGSFEEDEADDIERQFATNLFGLFNVTRAVLPTTRQQRRGHIFNISSVGGALGYSFASIDGAAKFAVEGFSESLAPEVAPFGIHVTIVEPGFFRTDFLDPSSVRYGSRSTGDAEFRRIAAEGRAFYQARNHQQAGDPSKLGAALVRLASEPQPPLRHAAGSDAYEAITGKLAAMRGELDRWHALSVPTDAVA